MSSYDHWKLRSDLDDWAAQNHDPPEERPTFTESEVAAAVEAERAACEAIARNRAYPEVIAAAITARRRR